MQGLKFFTIFIVFGLFCAQIFFSADQLNSRSWVGNSLRLTSNNTGISVQDIYTPESIIRIAPYQDFIYKSQWDKISLRQAFMGTLTPGISKTIINTLFPHDMSWALVNPAQSTLTYTIGYPSGNQVSIKRKIVSPDKIIAVGQSVYYCSDCVIVDPTNKQVFYTDTKADKDDNLILAGSLGYAPVQTSNEVIPDTKLLAVLDLKNGKTVFFPVGNNIVLLHDAYKVVEFIAPTEEMNSQYVVNQLLSFGTL